MKLLIQTITLFVLLVISSCTVQQYGQAPATTYSQAPAPAQAPTPDPNSGVSMQVFYDALSPYGQWIENPQYGYVWIPNVGPDFQPYATAGHWEYTEYGWTWVSDYPWGWAPFHYGRWYYDNIMGYAWIPDTQWGPAWVNWRSSPDYYGWAPMGPSGYNYPQNQWVFVNSNYINNPQVYNHYQGPQNAMVVYNQTTVIQNNYIVKNNVQYVAGPNVTEVEKVTGSTVTPVSIRASNEPGQSAHNNGQLTIYKPQISAVPSNTTAKPKPVTIVSTSQVVPVKERKTTVQPSSNPNSTPDNKQGRFQNEKLPVTPAQNEKPSPPSPLQQNQKQTEPSTPTNNSGQQPVHNATTAPAKNNTSSTSPSTPQAKPKTKTTKPKPAPKQSTTPTKPEEKH